MYNRFIKRLLDIVISLTGLIVLSPVILLISLMIRLDSNGPVFFRQKRIGIHKSTFHIYKFRTMFVDTPRDIPTHLLEDPEAFLTNAGKVLRKTSLDELPQLLNILLGHMSVIGPRPALWNQDDLIAARDLYGANDVLPGLTGWAQINGRDELEISEKAALDGEYVKRMSFLFDCQCFFGTFAAVITHRGVMEGGTKSKK
ncbi:MAG: sugar transferase [Clostridia bacterium]|nr:sugar transferase [Clostridia bacterium]